jgi:hypothetical protein
MEIVGMSWADPGDQNLRNPAISGWKDIFYSSDMTPPFGKGVLDISKLHYNSTQNLYGPPQFGPGDMTSYDGVRHPGATMFNLSLMKRFPILNSDGNRYVQFAMEAENFFNMHGYGNIDTDPRHSTFGFITGVRNTPRRIQMSVRLAF